MEKETLLLIATALTVGFFHTILGPDHYIPFAAMARAREWSNTKTFLITMLCGVGHVASSVILGIIGIVFGVSVVKLKFIETVRGEFATWFLIAFGLIYFTWAMVRKFREWEHQHQHTHESGAPHDHKHHHHHDHLHVHEEPGQASLTPWVLFIIFFFGPCEPLIPLVMYPALRSDWQSVMFVVGVFGAVTLATMLGMVFVTMIGLNSVLHRLEKHFHAVAGFSHAIAGLAVFICGVSIKCFGL